MFSHFTNNNMNKVQCFCFRSYLRDSVHWGDEMVDIEFESIWKWQTCQELRWSFEILPEYLTSNSLNTSSCLNDRIGRMVPKMTYMMVEEYLRQAYWTNTWLMWNSRSLIMCRHQNYLVRFRRIARVKESISHISLVNFWYVTWMTCVKQVNS